MSTGGNPRLLNWAAGLSVFAGIMHSLLTTSHFEEWWGYGVFFMVAAMAQSLYGFFVFASQLFHDEPLVSRWRRKQLRAFYAVGIAGNLALVLLYVVSRTVGIPLLGPEAGEVEPWDAFGLATKAMELVIAACLAVLIARSRGSRRPRPTAA